MAGFDTVAACGLYVSDTLVKIADARGWSDSQYQALDSAFLIIEKYSDDIQEYVSGCIEVMSTPTFSGYPGAEKTAAWLGSLTEDLTPSWLGLLADAVVDTVVDTAGVVAAAGSAAESVATGTGSFLSSGAGKVTLLIGAAIAAKAVL